jgi:hypothetical protein
MSSISHGAQAANDLIQVGLHLLGMSPSNENHRCEHGDSQGRDGAHNGEKNYPDRIHLENLANAGRAPLYRPSTYLGKLRV